MMRRLSSPDCENGGRDASAESPCRTGSHESVQDPRLRDGDFLAPTRLKNSPAKASDSMAQTLPQPLRPRITAKPSPQPSSSSKKSSGKSRKQILQEWQISFANRDHNRDGCHGPRKDPSAANVSHDNSATAFQLQTSVGQSNIKIPRQVILTGHFNSLQDVMEKRKDLLAALGITPDLTVLYFNDHDCRRFLRENNPELVKLFDAETHGSYRGDLCRTSVLAQKGGFYVDLDMQLRTPLTSLVDDNTSFMTAKSATSGFLNAIMATVPNNPVLHHTLARMTDWLSDSLLGKVLPGGLLGPETLRYGVEKVLNTHCPSVSFSDAYSQVNCGNQALRFFQEHVLVSPQLFLRDQICSMWGPSICPDKRAVSHVGLLNYGLFDGKTTHEDAVMWPSCEKVHRRERRMIGWSRYEECDRQGCGLSNGKTAR
jgi:hypothetical protein